MNKAEEHKLTRLLERLAQELKCGPYHLDRSHVIEHEIFTFVRELCDDYYKEGQMEGYDRGRMER